MSEGPIAPLSRDEQYERALHRLLNKVERLVVQRDMAEENREKWLELGTQIVSVELELRAGGGSGSRMKLRDITRFMEVQHRIAKDLRDTVHKAVTPVRDRAVGVPVHRIPSMVELVVRMQLPDATKREHVEAILHRLPLGEQAFFYDGVRAALGAEFMVGVNWSPPLELEEGEFEEMEREDEE